MVRLRLLSGKRHPLHGFRAPLHVRHAKNDVFVNLYVQSTAEIETQKNQLEIRQETDYPWDGKISLTIEPKKKQTFALRLRIPGWAQNRPVPTDLYHYVGEGKGFTLTVNGQETDYRMENGYAVVRRKWNKGDRVELNLPMEVRQVEANPQVLDDRGKAAIERGPIVYCIEDKDQPDSTVFNKFIPIGTPMASVCKPETLNGIVGLTGMAKALSRNGDVTDVPFHAIPYSVWNNRGNSQMAVWIPTAPSYARPEPLPDHRQQGPHADDTGSHPERRPRVGRHGSLGLGRERPVGTETLFGHVQALPLLVA